MSSEPDVTDPRPPLIARAYGFAAIALGVAGVAVLARSIPRPADDGFGLYAVPGLLLVFTPPALLAYLGARIARGERMAAYALAAVLLVAGVAVAVLEWRGGLLFTAIAIAAVLPLCLQARRASGGFH
jgi:hypothetical protein